LPRLSDVLNRGNVACNVGNVGNVGNLGNVGNADCPVSLSRAERAKAASIAGVLSPLVGSLGSTWTWRVDGAEHFDALMRGGQAPILAFWHGRILPGTVYFQDHDIVAMTSRNFDGEWIARILARFGVRSARGSTSRGGPRALVQMRRELNARHAVAFAVDGPRGPARVAQPGAVWLAGATGHPVLPFHLEANRYWTVGSWDRAMIPKPFARVSVAIGDPFDVPDTGAETIERSRKDLELRLASLQRTCEDLLH
jgi:lysophospholipid acyltransferase (LPLAT)-like uncharacterized protein